MQRLKPGEVGRLQWEASPSAWIGWMVLWGLLSWCGVKLFKFQGRHAILGGFLGSILHFLATIWHHWGHSRAAAITGFPMYGLRFWGVLATSVYPDDEPPLAATIHIQRAVGGPIASAALAAVAGLLALLTRPLSRFWHLLASFFFWDNLLVFTLGALTPLGFTDGHTILRWLPQLTRPNLVITPLEQVRD